MKTYEEFINEAKSYWKEVSFEELKKTKNEIRNYTVHLGSDKFELMSIPIHVGLASDNHYETIIEIAKKEKPTLKVKRVEVSTSKMKDFSIGKKDKNMINFNKIK